MNINERTEDINLSKHELFKKNEEKIYFIKLAKKQRFQRKKYIKKSLINFFVLAFAVFFSITISLIFIYFKNKKKSQRTKIIKSKPTKEDIYFEVKFPGLIESFNNAKNFIDKCLKGIIINNKALVYSENPKVSVLIPLYNCQRTISRAIKSVQNQNLSNIEIILINDFSSDNK